MVGHLDSRQSTLAVLLVINFMDVLGFSSEEDVWVSLQSGVFKLLRCSVHILVGVSRAVSVSDA